jgi:hypothetical protein
MEKKRKQTPEKGTGVSKDEQILSDVSRIIWNPGLLKKFQADGNPAPDGHSKVKKDVKKS